MENKFKRTTVTSALPYANGPVHIGHLAGVYVPADIYVRYLRLKKEDVLYLLGGQAYLDDDKYEEQALIEMWSRFNIEIGLDVFKGTIVKLIENAKDARVIFFSNNGFLNELYLKKGIIDRVFEIFDEKLNLIYKEMDLE